MPDWLTAALTSTVVSTALVGVLVFLFQNLLIQRLQAAVSVQMDRMSRKLDQGDNTPDEERY